MVGLFTRHLAGKIVLPYLIVIWLVAVLATSIAVDQISTGLEDKYQQELAAAGRSANEAMVVIEDRNLELLRQMVFTEDVDEAISIGNIDQLQQLLAPIATNARVSYVDVFNKQGEQVLALRAPDLSAQIDPAANNWAPVRGVLDGRIDQFGDKYTGIVHAPWGALLVTASPVKTMQGTIGVIALSTPVEEVAKRLSQDAGAKGITLYEMDGTPLATTLRGSRDKLASVLHLPLDLACPAIRSDRVVLRRASLDDVIYVEALGALAIRREPAVIVGTGDILGIIEERGAQARTLMVVLFAAVTLLVAYIGIRLTEVITRPVYALIEGTARIRRNDLDQDVPVRTSDEHGALTIAFNEMKGGLKERERARAAIERYMSPKLYHLIQSSELSMGGVSHELTVFKTDIRDFTRIAEQMEPSVLVSYLNRYFSAMVECVSKHNGEVDKYMGDAILAKFGATESYPDHAAQAVLAMIEMIEACDTLNRELAADGLPTIRMGIGANTGEAVVGNIGSAERMEYTIISSAVNTAQRIEELCKELGWDLLISESTYAQTKDLIAVGQAWRIQLRGQSRETLIYPVLGRRGLVPGRRLQAYSELLRVASGGSLPGGHRLRSEERALQYSAASRAAH